jgi:hypothetical protein
MKGYDNALYAGSRLDQTVIRKDKTPILVQSCEDNSMGIIVNWKGIMETGYGVDYLHDLNLNPVPLGYVNHNDTVTYMTRMPMREDWKQGLRDRNITTADGFNNELSYKQIGHTIMGNFPKFSKVLEGVCSNAFCMAFDRDFVVTREGKIGYKGSFIIGKVDLISGSINIDDSFSWVREAFEEAMEKAA